MSRFDGKISILLPAFNEAGALAETVRGARGALEGEDVEVVVVDDGSRDGTWEEIARLAASMPGIVGLRLSRNFGHQSALLAGLEVARGEAVIMMDADGQHPSEVLPGLVDRWRRGALIVQAIRRDSGGTGLFKKLTSGIFYRIFSWLAAAPITPGASDFRLLDRRAVALLLAHPRSALFLRGFFPWTGLHTTFFEYTPRRRFAGATKYSVGRMLRLAQQGVMCFSVKPLRVGTFIGLVTCVVALSYLVFVVAVRLWGNDFVPGWASVAGLLSLLGGVQLIVMGILGEYIGMIFEAQLDRPPFVIAEQLGVEEDPTAPGPPRSSPRSPA